MTKDLFIRFTIGNFRECTKWEDGIHVTEQKNLTLTLLSLLFDCADAPLHHWGLRGAKAGKHVIACRLVLNELNLRTEFTRFFGDDCSDSIHRSFIVRGGFSFDKKFEEGLRFHASPKPV